MEIYENLCMASLPNEEWRDVVGWEGLYRVSNLGRVLCCDKTTRHNRRLSAKIKQCVIRQTGYLSTTFYDAYTGRRKIVDVHRLVAEAFIPNPDKKPCIDHIDCNPLNNIVCNLRWSTYKENSNNVLTKQRQSIAQRKVLAREGFIQKKIDASHKKTICQYTLSGKYVATYSSFHEVERELGFCCSNIHNCCNGKKKTAYGYVWRYKHDTKVSYTIRTNAKPVIQLDLEDNFIQEYKSATEASQKTGICKSCICVCCKGKTKTAGNYKWRYKNEFAKI